MKSAIVGIGLDVVEMERIAGVLASPAGDRFVARVLTANERDVFQRLTAKKRTQYVAGRFALKEAVVKALGCGIGSIVGFQDIEAMPDELGKPVCFISAEALERLGRKGQPLRLHVAITHERSIAAATALIENDQ
ncbi:holo-ACP synthase [Cohnella yongneupensis]|uniref:Holo-[acyl-carrier-protein] synthase n=1 Tax=Cohnella yongneupensis TaxID=425006 RepID=A0ABW0QZW4_9BACL